MQGASVFGPLERLCTALHSRRITFQPLVADFSECERGGRRTRRKCDRRQRTQAIGVTRALYLRLSNRVLAKPRGKMALRFPFIWTG